MNTFLSDGVRALIARASVIADLRGASAIEPAHVLMAALEQDAVFRNECEQVGVTNGLLESVAPHKASRAGWQIPPAPRVLEALDGVVRIDRGEFVARLCLGAPELSMVWGQADDADQRPQSVVRAARSMHDIPLSLRSGTQGVLEADAEMRPWMSDPGRFN